MTPSTGIYFRSAITVAALPCCCCLQGPPATWWSQLRHLDLSGQVMISDDTIGTTLNKCNNLVTLSIANTAAGPLTFMSRPARSPPPPGAAEAAAKATTAAAAAAAAADSSVLNRGPYSMMSFMAGEGRSTPLLLQVVNALTARRPAERQQAAAAAAGPSAAAATCSSSVVVVDVIPSEPPVCLLKVLDVSGCASLALGAAGAAVFGLFRSAVGAMPHLEGGRGGGCIHMQ